MSTIKSSAEHLTLNADGANNDIKFQSNGSEVASIDQAGNIALSGTVDGVDVAARDSVLTSTTATASAALPKAGGSLTGPVDWNNDSVYFKGNATHGYRFNSANDSANLVTIYDNGDTKVWAGDIYFGTAGKGIVLGATTNSAANTLDDYEEGTWTPALAAATVSAINSAVYTKIGRVVNASCYIVLAGDGTSTAAELTGLPFTIKTGTYPTAVFQFSANSGSGTVGRGQSNSTTVAVYREAGNQTGVPINEIDNGHWMLNITYMV
jgi:hypothetical protein